MSVVIQKGTGARRPLVIGYYIGPPATQKLQEILGPGPCIVSDLDDTGGRFAKIPGAGGVDTIAQALVKANQGNPFAASAVIIVGWSAGCQAVREQLRLAPLLVDAAIALDGISGQTPIDATSEKLTPYLAYAARASSGAGPFFLVTHTQQTYTEHLPPTQRFASTVTTAKILCEALGIAAPDPGFETSLSNFFAISSPSKPIDGTAHIAQVRVVGPDAMKRFLVPWLVARGEPAPPVLFDPSRPPPVPTAPTPATPPDAPPAPPAMGS